MATPVNVGDIVLWRHACMSPSQVGLNDWYFKITANTGSPTYESLINPADLVASVVYRPCISTTFTRYGSQFRIVTSPLLAPISTSANSLAGTDMGTPLSTQVSGIITKRTSLIGRANRGRAYIPFPTDTFLDTDGTPTVAYTALLNAIALLFLTPETISDGAGNSAIFTPIIYNVHPGSSTLVSSYTLHKRWATQRRRGNYGRPNPPPW